MDGTRASPSNDDGQPGPKPPAGSAYEKYKQSLHAFFNGDKPLPDHLRDLLATRPGASEHLDGVEEVEAKAQPVAPAPKKGKPARAARGPEDRKRRMVATSSDDYASLVEAIRRATSPREVESAIDALLEKGHALPMDGEVLSKALGHSSETVLAMALRGLSSVVDSGSLKSVQLLKTRVNNVALLASSSDVRELCGELRSKLG
jgi:hypothetical protein